MTHLRRFALLALLGGCAASAAATQAEGSPRCQVWKRELGFARSVAEHDQAAFAGHLHEAAAFGVGRTPTLGREAVLEAWKGIIDGSAVTLEWYPDVVTVGGDGTIAYSSGPALYRDPQTGTYRLSRFGSVWQRGVDGQWRVVFDDGSRSEPADEAAVRAFHAGRRDACSEA